MTNIGILAIDDDPDALDEIKRAIQATEAAKNTEYKLFMAEDELINDLSEDIHLYIVDHFLTNRTGLDVLKLIKNKNPGSYVIGYSGIKDGDVLIKYIKAKIDDWVDKSKFDGRFNDLVKAIDDGMDIAKARVDLYNRATHNQQKK